MEGKLFKGLYCSGILGGSPLKELHPNEYSALENSRRIQPTQQQFQQENQSGIFVNFMRKLVGPTITESAQLRFDQLQSPLMPDIFQPVKCGCENTLEPCSKIMEITKGNLEHMKAEYVSGKRLREQYGYLTINQHLLMLIPATFPETLSAQLENILRQTSVSEQAMHMLCRIVQHCKLEHLSYWLFSQLNLFRMQQEQLAGMLYNMVQMRSQGILTVIAKCPSYFDENAKLFLKTLGTSLIPTERYAQFLKRLSIQGRTYPCKVFFCLVLCHKDEILSDRNIATYFGWLPGKTCWNRVFTAAEDPRLTI